MKNLIQLVVCLVYSLHSSEGFLSPSGVDCRRGRGKYAVLVPEGDPNADPNRESRAGVRYSEVLSGLNALFPPEDLEKRNAASRTDGYWSFIREGKDPPKQLTYGEFDFYFFADLLDKTIDYYNKCHDVKITSWDGKVFADIGSGTGRLVFAAAGLLPWKLCRGIEILPSIHKVAVENLEKCETPAVFSLAQPTFSLPALEPESTRVPLTPIEFTCGSFSDPYTYFGDVDLIFVFSSLMTSDMMKDLSAAIGRQCKPGTIVITTEFPLPLEGTVGAVEGDPSIPSGSYKLELLDRVDGFVWVTGGISTAYIHSVVSFE